MLKTVQQRVQEITPPIRMITAEEAARECENNDGCLIDVREPAENAQDAVDFAINFPRGVLEMKMVEKFTDSATPIYLHCASGVRAQLAAEQLHRMGYENVSVITCKVPEIKKHF